MNEDEEIEKFGELINVGTKFKLNYPNDKYLYHVIGIFDGWNIAVKYFGKHKQWWHYEFMDLSYLYFADKSGHFVIKES
jgi:hypothetical protein